MSLNWSKDELAAYSRKRGLPLLANQSGARAAGMLPTSEGTGRPPQQSHAPGRMNKTEAAYAEHLTSLGYRWKFEPIKLWLAPKTTYRPDFLVWTENARGEVERDSQTAFHEVKGGFIREDGWVKFKVAREQFPMFRFIAMQKTKDGWKEIQ